jgi:serine/threonine protein kinase
MAQSYDVYFARMLLTLGLVERDRLQSLLAEVQRLPEAKGFPKFLVERGVIDAETSRSVAADLERYLLGRRSSQRETTAEKPRADEPSARDEASAGSSGRSRAPSSREPMAPAESKKRTSGVHKATPEEPVAAPRSSRLPGARGSSSERVRKSTDPAVKAPASAGASARQRALLDRATKDPLAKFVGRRLGRTEVTKLIETGPFVTVFEGRYGDDERAAVVKILRPDRMKDREAVERFSREAKALEKIDHPNIARVFEAGEAEKLRFLSIEASTGEALSVLLERVGRLPPERVQKIGRATALALAAAHRSGIIHRDVRPANVFIEDDGTVKIAGFGMARDVQVPGRLTATGQITGHPSYVAPEIASGEEVTGKVDVYSLGIVLYLTLAGRLPFESTSVVKLVGMQMNTPPPPLLDAVPGCPPKLALLVERLLAKNPAQRPEAMEAANLLAAKDLLEGGSDIVTAAAAPKPDSEDELRRMLAPDEALEPDAAVEDEPAPAPIGGPSCAACELPIGSKATSLHGNSICERCLDRVEALDLCAACFQELSETDRGAKDTAVFAGHVYCRACTGRVRLPCAQCSKPVGLAELPKGRAKAKGDQLVHVSCPS